MGDIDFHVLDFTFYVLDFDVLHVEFDALHLDFDVLDFHVLYFEIFIFCFEKHFHALSSVHGDLGPPSGGRTPRASPTPPRMPTRGGRDCVAGFSFS